MDRQRLDYSHMAIKAAAGCGKTFRIAESVKKVTDSGERRPCLILTHTHAGVDSLRKKLEQNGVPQSFYHVDTIAAWSLRYASSFPNTSGLEITKPGDDDWENVYLAAAKLLKNSAARGVVPISYYKVYVDEYQDCTVNQHELILQLGKLIPCRILGDPLQGIFNIGESALIDWERDVVPYFYIKDDLLKPWRWKDTPELGDWLSQARSSLENGNPINLKSLPSSIKWRKLPANGAAANVQRDVCFKSGDEGTTIAIHNVNNQCHYLAQRLAGKFGCIEAINCKDLMNGAEKIYNSNGGARAFEVITFAKRCITQVGTILSNVQEQALRDNKTPSWKSNNQHKEQLESLVYVAESQSLMPVISALQAISENTNAKIFRKELYYEMIRAIKEFERGDYDSLKDAAWQIRNITRRIGRKISNHAIGTTLLVKGLEFDHSIILDADGMDRKNLYVAMTRGSKTLTILSKYPIINPNS
ncbi:MAG: hypothetical protein A2Y12_04485 [Planctomycetes bacterium GWF2_42_9]|nr:MAG: hypothetical protein A2Y12_04485 [Planctomycetes bacterium GWF2_42_9]